MDQLITAALKKGAQIYGSISGGKDGDAMIEALVANGIKIKGLVHADLGRVEWKESHDQCRKCADKFNLPLHIATRADGRDMLDHWQARSEKLKAEGTNKPFWSSSSNRYCTSDMKRDPINRFFTSTGDNFIISCEGIRAQESTARAQKDPLTIRRGTSTFYKGMTPAEAIENYSPDHRLLITWFPIFNFTIEEVWSTKGQTPASLLQAREIYQETGTVPTWWVFHPAYAYGNERVSCVFCIMGSANDMEVGAKHRPELLDQMITMEQEGGATFKNKWSLQQLKK